MSKSPAPPLLILGMHRSGTSLAASVLESAGLDIGNRLMMGNAWNPVGHFEDMDFVDFHRAALTGLGLGEEGWLTSDLPELSSDLIATARTLAEYRRQSDRPWGWKDPRTVLFLPLWMSLIPDARFVIVYRAPWEVVDSLYARGDRAFVEDPDLAVKVWEYYNRTLLHLALASPEKCVIASLGAIAAEPAAWVAAVSERTGVPLRNADSGIFKKTLLHGERASDRAGLISSLYPAVAELFASLERHALRLSEASTPAPSTISFPPLPERTRAMRDWQAGTAAEANRKKAAPVPRNSSAPGKSNAGWCPCCRTETYFVETGTWLRDQYLCERCQSIPRLRAVNLTLDMYFTGWDRLRVHEFAPATDFIRRHCQRYSSSQFLEDVRPGTERDGVRCEAIEQLTFPDESFDVFVTQDVIEHLFDPERAVHEIMRVVKPGGAHIFTTQKHPELRRTRRRARTENDAVVHLLPPKYQGDSRHDRHGLVTWEFGNDFEFQLWKWCGYPTISYVHRDRRAGLDGEYLDVFVTRKF
jgi:SAM-dependent methyltransferase